MRVKYGLVMSVKVLCEKEEGDMRWWLDENKMVRVAMTAAASEKYK